jgi:4-carboxymuconolactone decarboxylase
MERNRSVHPGRRVRDEVDEPAHAAPWHKSSAGTSNEGPNLMKRSDSINLGGRLPLLDPTSLDAEHQEIYNLLDSGMVAWARGNGFKGATENGELIGPFNPDLYGVGITPAYLQFLQAESSATSLDKRVREVVILSTVAVWKSPYALYAHSAVARNLGIPEAAIAELVEGKCSEELSSREQLACTFAHQLSAEHTVHAKLYKEAEAEFGAKGLIDMLYLIGIYLLTAATLNAFEVPAPE